MCNINYINIDYVSRLANISLNNNEKKKFSKQLNSFIKHFELLKEVDINKINPMDHVFLANNVWQKDSTPKILNLEKFLKNKNYNYQTTIPKVIE